MFSNLSYINKVFRNELISQSAYFVTKVYIGGCYSESSSLTNDVGVGTLTYDSIVAIELRNLL